MDFLRTRLCFYFPEYESKHNENIALYNTIADKCRAKVRPLPPCVANDEGLGEDGA